MRLKLTVAALALGASVPALAQADRTVLPIPKPAFDGTIAENVLDSKPMATRPVRAPQGAPNVLLFMSDDVGFSMSSTFGGPVPTPNFERLAAAGQRYNRFHTTGVCSPSRAALLTGRNHHNVATGNVTDLASGYPGYSGAIPAEAATVAQILRLNGYSTAMFGKHHNLPPGEGSAAGPFDRWPTGLGFEYFYGFVTADSDKFDPNMVRGTSRVDPDEGKGRILEQRLADDMIGWVHNQKAAAPDKPFFIYYSTASTHAPHQAPPEYIARFKGRFDRGWDAMRTETHRRQLAAGIIPKGTKLTPRPDGIPAWESLASSQKAFAARTMEVAAAELAYQDEQFGRVIDELERMGQLDNTLVAIVLGDNGASLDTGPNGTLNELRNMTGGREDPRWLVANIDRLGGPMTYQNYPVGWAWAMNTPLRWGKKYVSMLGGVRNGMILSWKEHIARPGAVCSQFGHLIDMAPTILEATRLPAPAKVYGVTQKPMDGQSLLASLKACDPDRPRTQYFEIEGKIGLYHDGWFASNDDGRLIWGGHAASNPRPQTQWTLYDLRRDFSQSDDLAARNPEQMRLMEALWQREAERNHVFPLDYRAMAGRAETGASAVRTHYDYWGKDVSVSGNIGPGWAGRSFTIDAQIVPGKADASGVIAATGSHFGGWSLFLDQGRPSFVYAASTDPAEIVRIASTKAMPAGKGNLRLRFDFRGFDKGAVVSLLSGTTQLATGQIDSLFLTTAGLGETFDIGRDLGVPVTGYSTHRGVFEGDIPHVSLRFDAPGR